ncbi:MAG: putative polyketide biosynthesis zinc-dependent hydrolase BaeB [Syntrophorhabdus sp. PtaU1.Bin153]|nr:MAG: putative polyketide biosynthesis zinc-dependent hydrolase BaeB [Syntrophorhabdus sp. PtaU1.Bin153]
MIFKHFNFEGCLSYILACPAGRKGVIIDPSHEIQPYIDFVTANGIDILYVIDTHTHVDHISLSPELARLFGAKTVMNTLAPAQREIGATVTELFGIEKIIAENATKPVDLYLDENDSLSAGSIILKVLHTPGHTKDSMCLLADDRIFTGDTLIIGQCGRTDLPGGNPQDMYDSLFEKLAPLSNDLIVYPAHDYRGNINSSLGYEKINNVCLKTLRTVEEFTMFLKGLFPPLDAGGGKLQCGLSMGDTTPSVGDDQLNPLMKSFCISMEHYLRAPHEATLVRTGELLERVKQKENIVILDVREPRELAELGFIAGAINIPVKEVAERISELPKDLDHPIVVICESGIRSAHAAIYLRGYGYTNVKNLEFGIREWRNNGYPLIFPDNSP